MIPRLLFPLTTFLLLVATVPFFAEDLSTLKKDQLIADFRVANLYADSEGRVIGGKFLHIPTGAPIHLLQIETVPQVFMWVDVPGDSNRGVAHSLEHILAAKGEKGRYLTLLTEMRLSRRVAATYRDYTFYSFASGSGMPGFFEQFHAWLDALYRPDFTDLEAEREFYHFGVASDSASRQKTLVEQGTVYNEMLTSQGQFDYFRQLRKRVFGNTNPFAFEITGVPDEMRGVSPEEIRRFHAMHYRLGPGTGFIFAMDSKESVQSFLERISNEFRQFSPAVPTKGATLTSTEEPKYPISPIPDKEIEISSFPSTTEIGRGEVSFAWEALRTDSKVDLKLLQLFFNAFAQGEQSLLYRTLVDTKTREFESGATNVESWAFLENSPRFPVEFIGVKGIPGNQITIALIERIRNLVLRKIRELSQYPDDDRSLVAFNKLAATQARAQRRSDGISVKSAPLFGVSYSSDWKEQLNYLEMDPSFVRSLSDESVWNEIESRLQSGKNVWRTLIQEFHLLNTPYATGSTPSPRLLREIETARQSRAQEELKRVMVRFGVSDEQQALELFEKEEISKTAEIDKIEAKVRQPRFTDHPPLTLDDDIKYEQLSIQGVPAVAALFQRAPTIDVGLSFDLRNVPKKYYKYLPIFARCFDSLGLKEGGAVTPYTALLAETQKSLHDFSVAPDYSAVTGRADLTIRTSAISLQELRAGLSLLQRILRDAYIDVANVDRFRDLVNQRLTRDDTFKRRNGSYWFANPAYVFKFQDRPLYVTLHSFFTQAHSNDRLKWLIHKPVSADEIHQLDVFANDLLTSSRSLSAQELLTRMSQSNANGLRRELVEYWRRNIASFPDSELISGLQDLTKEVEEDLSQGPDRTIEDLKDLKRIVLDRRTLKLDVTLDPAVLPAVRPVLFEFLKSIPLGQQTIQQQPSQVRDKFPIMSRVRRRYGVTEGDFPWYVALADPDSQTASVMFSADFFGYSQLDRRSLVQALSTKLVSGTGPHSLFMKTIEDGLAYSNLVKSDPSWRLVWYYAERSPNIVALVALVNSIATKIPDFHEPYMVDYALRGTFAVPRSLLSFSDRGKGLAQDIYDGNDPQTVRHFSEAILRLRNDPGLLSEITRAGLPSIGGVLLDPEFKDEQRSSRSIFFFAGPERLLHEAEQNLPIPKLLRLYPSDFWVESSDMPSN